MNTLHFKRLRYRNLLSTGASWTEINLEAFPMTLVVGKNGDGKSTVIDALCFALFGKPFRKINKPQLLNSVTKKELVVEVEFASRGFLFKIVRGIKPAVFEVWRSGILLNQDAATRDYQTDLEKYILRTNFNTFSQIVILGSANYVPFMQLKASARREVIEDLYDLRIFTSMNSLLKDRLTKAEREVDRLENERERLEQKLELSQKHQVVVVEDKQKWIEAKTADIDRSLTEITRLDEGAETIRKNSAFLKPIVEQETQHNKKLEELDRLKRKIEMNADSLKKEVKFLEDHNDCPTCKQEIYLEFKDEMVAQKKLKLSEIDSALGMMIAKIVATTAIRDTFSHASKTIRENDTKLIVLKSQIMNEKAIIARLEKEIDQLEEEHDTAVDESSLVELETEILERKREWAALIRQRDLMSYVGILLKDTGIKSRIIKKYSGTFNQLVNSYLAKLDFFVDFHLDENFEEVIKSRGRDTFSYNSFSEGEKLRIDLAVLFSWRQIAKMRASLNTNLLIMDEIFDGSLDTAGVEELLKIMKRVTEGNNVFVISHQTDRLSDHFDRTLTFTKTRGFSQIESR